MSEETCYAAGLYRPDGTLKKVVMAYPLSDVRKDNILAMAWPDIQGDYHQAGTPRPEAERKADALGWTVRRVRITPD